MYSRRLEVGIVGLCGMSSCIFCVYLHWTAKQKSVEEWKGQMKAFMFSGFICASITFYPDGNASSLQQTVAIRLVCDGHFSDFLESIYMLQKSADHSMETTVLAQLCLLFSFLVWFQCENGDKIAFFIILLLSFSFLIRVYFLSTVT